MSAHRLLFDLDSVLRHKFADVEDPGASGEIGIENNALAICRVTTATSESRTVEDADNFAVGQRLLVVLENDGGDLTIDTDAADVVLDTAGQFAEFVVTNDGTNNVWSTVSASNQTAGVNLPASAGTYEFAVTPDADDAVAGILAIVSALDTAGLIDGSAITQATS
jgi:hypothetical protein